MARGVTTAQFLVYALDPPVSSLNVQGFQRPVAH